MKNQINKILVTSAERYNFKTVEKKWQDNINKKNSKNKNVFDRIYFASELSNLESLIEKEKSKYFGIFSNILNVLEYFGIF